MPEKSQTKGLDLDEKLVRRLADLLHEADLNEIEYESGGKRIRVARGAPAAAPAPAPSTPAPAASAATSPAPSPGTSSEPLPPGAVTSPMVATVYVAAEPGDAPFVQVGDTVKEGDTLLILEAMKVMNPLTAPRAGKITQIFVSDAQPVEYGEPLLVIE
ncbi:MAG: acetyl-CoA carboxylase biotin carboxyl carrier protein [Rhodovibrionaceae bacterium]|nr:acetyl-CoA carboxylase biotin carboxyl carrier protein [Rhodovibrionaceae bacterium]